LLASGPMAMGPDGTIYLLMAANKGQDLPYLAAF
jgi:hypothetical protein